MTKHLSVAAFIIVLTLIGYFQFPGHTYLQADTQVYVPILEHYWDQSVLEGDLIARHPHVSFTIYDEVTLGLRYLTGLGTEGALTVQQLVFRALGILGIFLIAASLQLSTRMALLVAAIFSLGATVSGPSVLTLEYEAIPRGFAVPLLLLAVGFAAHGRDVAAGIAAAAAFLYQAPAGYTFWIVYFCLALWPSKPVVMRRRILGLLPLLLAVIVMFILSRHQHGVTEPQDFFGGISPALEKLQRMRSPYNWVSMWPHQWFWHYSFLTAVCLAAFARLRRLVFKDLQFFLVGMPVLGLLSLPASYLLLEKLKWGLIPQLQPMRAVLFITIFAGVLACIAGIKAAQARHGLESFLWFVVAFAIPADPLVFRLLLPNLADPVVRRLASIVLVLAAASVVVAWAGERRTQWSFAAWGALALAPFFMFPAWGKVTNYPDLWSPQLVDLARWARSSTPKEAVFLFPDAGKQIYPGIFRSEALRTVYTDWKTGGQANFFPKLGEEWWRRWQLTMADNFDASKAGLADSLGVDYLVVQPAHRLRDRAPVYENSSFIVYRFAEPSLHFPPAPCCGAR